MSIPPKARQAFDKGADLLSKKDAAGSLLQFQRAVDVYPNYYEAWYEIGAANLTLNCVADAELAFLQSVDLSGGQYAPAQFGLSAVLIYQREFADAERASRTGLELDPASWSGHYYLAWALYGQDRMEDAEKNATEALRQKNDSTEVLRLLADIHSREKDYRSLVNDLDAYLKLDPNSPTATRVKAMRAAAQRLLTESENTTAYARP